MSTQGNEPRLYCFGYGVFDENLNMHKTRREKSLFRVQRLLDTVRVLSSIRTEPAGEHARLVDCGNLLQDRRQAF